MTNKFLEAALKYNEMGFSVIPFTPGEKKPIVSWREYQSKKASIDEIKKWWSQTPNANVGIVTGKLSNLFVIDLDKYKPDYNETEVNKLISDSIVTPTAISPQGGQHLYFRFPAEELSINAGVIPGVDYRGEGGVIVSPPSINGNGRGYSWIEGLSIFDLPLAPVPESFKKALLNNDKYIIYARDGEKTCQQVSTLSTSVYTQGTRDQDLFHIAHLLVKAGCEDKYLYKTLEILALNCNPPFPLEEAITKIRSAIDRANKKEMNLTDEVREFVLSTNGIFLSTEVAKCLHLSTREEMKALSVILGRLEKKEKLIVKDGNRNGQYKTIDQSEELIDYINADKTPYPIKMPLGLQEFVTIYPCSVIVVAGESNAGKSAFCLNVAKMNCNTHPVNYMSSEMQDGTELRIRLDEFTVPIESWKKVKFTFRTDGYPDKIEPNGLNIIDYLDEGTDAEAYKMSMRIRKIADKLNKGIAIIAIQKDPNKDLGFGGAGTLNRARLYVNITRGGTITIKKAKSWRNRNINPNGLFCNFKLVGGANFIKESEWKL